MIGVRGLLYCNQTHSFTTPFIATSEVHPAEVVMDIWPEPWVLPFSIKPLGDPNKQVYKDDAAGRWPTLVERMPHHRSVTAALNITGTTVFVPSDILELDWEMILSDLAFEKG